MLGIIIIYTMENRWDYVRKYKCQWDKIDSEFTRWKSEIKGSTFDEIDIPSFDKTQSNIPNRITNNKNFNLKEHNIDGSDFIIVEEESDDNSELNEGLWVNLDEFKKRKQEKLSREKMLELQLPYDHIILPIK